MRDAVHIACERPQHIIGSIPRLIMPCDDPSVGCSSRIQYCRLFKALSALTVIEYPRSGLHRLPAPLPMQGVECPALAAIWEAVRIPLKANEIRLPPRVTNHRTGIRIGRIACVESTESQIVLIP